MQTVSLPLLSAFILSAQRTRCLSTVPPPGIKLLNESSIGFAAGVGVGEAVGVGEGVGVGVGVRVGFAVGVGVGEGDGVSVGVGVVPPPVLSDTYVIEPRFLEAGRRLVTDIQSITGTLTSACISSPTTL